MMAEDSGDLIARAVATEKARPKKRVIVIADNRKAASIAALLAAVGGISLADVVEVAINGDKPAERRLLRDVALFAGKGGR